MGQHEWSRRLLLNLIDRLRDGRCSTADVERVRAELRHAGTLTEKAEATLTDLQQALRDASELKKSQPCGASVRKLLDG